MTCRDRIGGRTVNKCRTTNARITALHSFIRFPIRGRSAPDGLGSPSYGRLRSIVRRLPSMMPIRGRFAPFRMCRKTVAGSGGNNRKTQPDDCHFGRPDPWHGSITSQKARWLPTSPENL